ncbi:MAG TPA: RidA family protein [Solirubrobacterales bacterium]|nr:RidA family protein [Solirubrobacterales bacterium]
MLDLPLSQYRIHGDLVFVSGQVGFESDGSIPAGFARQAELAFEALLATLASAGSSPADLLKVTVYLRRASDFAEFNELYAKYVSEPWPARTTLVTELVLPGLLFELDAIARIGGER